MASTSLAGDTCSADNCARFVAGTKPGIAVPLEYRISLCSRILATTQVTVTSTLTKYTTKLPAPTTPGLNTTTTMTPAQVPTLLPRAVPAVAVAHCSNHGQFASACRCWTQITPPNHALAPPVATVTHYLDVGCSPSAGRFTCSTGHGLCSCLKAGRDDVCVRVNGGWGANGTSPCATHGECDADGQCGKGHICVYDGSCACGKRRCYPAAPKGCNVQMLAVERRKPPARGYRN
ncbi:hypothetical protein QQX98_001492 [Neonectria punicea]|uniref:Uncharacterized protein n=1 Tax=Neonectria punicea TaxID=979145 RepID=A0ABR1HPH0_9HYPO